MQSSTQDHKDLGVRGCAENLASTAITLTKWLKTSENQVIFLFVVLVIMHLMYRRKLPVSDLELRDAKDALDVLKKQSTFWG